MYPRITGDTHPKGEIMNYDFIAIPDARCPSSERPSVPAPRRHLCQRDQQDRQHVAGDPDDLLDFKPHDKVNTIRAILVHQILSERRFFAQFVGTEEPPVEELPPGDQATGPSLPGQVRRAGEASVAAACRGKRRLVADGDAILRRAEDGNGSGRSGGVSFTPATIEHRSRPGCGWRVSMSRRFTDHPAM